MCVVEHNLKVSLSTINHRLYFTHKMKTAILKTRFHPNILQLTQCVFTCLHATIIWVLFAIDLNRPPIKQILYACMAMTMIYTRKMFFVLFGHVLWFKKRALSCVSYVTWAWNRWWLLLRKYGLTSNSSQQRLLIEMQCEDHDMHLKVIQYCKYLKTKHVLCDFKACDFLAFKD